MRGVNDWESEYVSGPHKNVFSHTNLNLDLLDEDMRDLFIHCIYFYSTIIGFK